MKSGKGRVLPLLLVVVAVSLWVYDQKHAAGNAPKSPLPRAEKSPTPPASRKQPTAKKAETTGGYEFYHGCTLVPARGNDGDSFKVKLPDGRTSELRLYFVDTPESAFKTYGGGETNHARIADQAADLGGVTPKQAVEIGQKAKQFTLALLASASFDIFTRWDSPFNDQRYHAFVRINSGGKDRWLHEILVEKGFVRIHTKGAALPDGTSYPTQKAHLKQLESTAKKAGVGVWGL
ncbi:MAG: thermonuclease family protein [Verrucomicrobiota bacterium]